jgi:hypothetical protein
MACTFNTRFARNDIHKHLTLKVNYVFESPFAEYFCRLRRDAKVNKKNCIKIIARVYSQQHFFTAHLLECVSEIGCKQKFLGHWNIKTSSTTNLMLL